MDLRKRLCHAFILSLACMIVPTVTNISTVPHLFFKSLAPLLPLHHLFSINCQPSKEYCRNETMQQEAFPGLPLAFELDLYCCIDYQLVIFSDSVVCIVHFVLQLIEGECPLPSKGQLSYFQFLMIIGKTSINFACQFVCNCVPKFVW